MIWPVGKPRAENLCGASFGRLTVQSRAPNRGDERAYWDCICLCGAKTTVNGSDLKSGHSKSCGCLSVDVNRQKATTHGRGRSEKANRDKTYLAWLNMRRRCENKSAKGYSNYGGRGIKVCPQWSDFHQFLQDMGPSPEGTSIERKEVDGDYEPGNCIWADYETQCNNKRTTVRVSFDGMTMSAMQASRKLGIPYEKLRWLIRKHGDGWYSRAAAAMAPEKAG